MSVNIPVPADVVRIVDDYVASELGYVARHDNRELLDESGIYSLHVAVAEVYSSGYEAGRRYQAALADGRRLREFTRKEQA